MKETELKKFPHPICTVDGVLLVIEDDQLKVLLHKRPNEPFKDHWALPGGYIHLDSDQSSDEAIQRIMSDKTGLAELYLEQLKTYSGPDRDPRGWSVSIAHLALVSRNNLDMGSALDNVELFSVSDLPELSFDHAKIIGDALSRLQGKGAYSSLPAFLLDESFTLSSLRRAYEIVLNEKINPSAFRRKIFALGMLEETGETTKEESPRPAVVYRLTGSLTTYNRYLGQT